MSTPDRPPTVAARRGELAARLAGAPGVLLCLDFDGTLAPVVPDPDDAAMAPACRAALERLVDRPSVDVAIVSGRALADLRDRVALAGATCAGNHGLELDRGDGAVVHPDARAARPALERAVAAVRERTDAVPGCIVEDKGVTATVHYRQVDEADVPAVLEAVEDAVADVDTDGQLEVTTGKQIRELRPAVDRDKGDAVERLAADVPDDWLAVYVGDDTTDEDAIAAVEPDGIGIRVGDAPGTAASYRLADRERVVGLLDLVDECAGDAPDERVRASDRSRPGDR